MSKTLLSYWKNSAVEYASVNEEIQQAKDQHPWFCLPKMLEAKASGDPLSIMEAAMHAPDRAKLHEWIASESGSTQEKASSPSIPKSSSLFGLTSFHPPLTLSNGGTGPLDTKVQVLIGKYFGLAKSIRASLRPAASQPATKPVEVKVEKKVIQTREGLLYKKDSLRIPISISEEQKALFETPPSEATGPVIPVSLTITDLRLRGVDELIQTEADKAIKASISQDEPPASATMAKLLALQGDSSGAIAIYERLSLANPDKKAYFEAQIQQLTKNLK